MNIDLMEAARQFRDAIAAAGIEPPPEVIADGRLHYYPTNGKRHDDAGRYILFPDDVPAGWAKDWRADREITWCAGPDTDDLSPQERADRRERIRQAQQASEAKEKHAHEQAAAKAKKIWDDAPLAGADHAYCVRKGIKAHGLKLTEDGALIVPLWDGGKLTSLQYISPDGDKRFLTGGKVAGSWCPLGDPAKSTTLLLCEGFATAASLREATGHFVAAALFAGNLVAVALALRAKYGPDKTIILCADDDASSERNPGLKYAREAALACNGRLAVPDFGEERSDRQSDFNDLVQMRGLQAVKQCVKQLEAAPAVMPAPAQPPAPEASVPESPPARTQADPAQITTEAQPATISISRERHQVVDAAMPVIAARPSIFQRGATLVRVAKASDLPENKYVESFDPQRLLISPAPREYLATELSRGATFTRFDGRAKKELPVHPPGWLPAALLAESEFPGVRLLRAITSAPIIRPDGSLWTTPGYDPVTALLYAPTGPLPAIKQPATKDDAIAALAALRIPFSRYPFADELSRSVVLSLILTRLARHLFATAPLHLFTSPIAGCGKTYIVEATSQIIDGLAATLASWPEDDAEMRKFITSCLLAGQSLVTFDNVPNGKILRSAQLDKALTAVIWQDRRLGESETITAPNTATWAVTGNNVSPSQDSVRRCISARITPDCEHPWDRAFPWNPVEYAKAHRAELLAAATTILAAFLRSGAPQQASIVSLGSFEDWSHTVRSCLLWLDMPDPTSSQDSLLLEDPSAAERSDLFGALHAKFSSQRFSSAEILRAVENSAAGFPSEDDRALLSVFRSAWPDGRINSNRIGHTLRQHKDQVCGNLILRANPERHTKVVHWLLQQRGL